MTSNWEQFRSAGSYDKFRTDAPVVVPGRPPYACLAVFTVKKGHAYVYNFGNANKVSRYTAASSYTRVRDGYTFVCNLYGFHFFVICSVPQPGDRPTYEVHVLDESNASRGSATTKDLDTFFYTFKRGTLDPDMQRYMLTLVDQSVNGAQGANEEWRRVYKKDMRADSWLCSYRVRSLGIEPIRATRVRIGFTDVWAVNGVAIEWIARDLRLEVLMHVDAELKASFVIRFVGRVGVEKERSPVDRTNASDDWTQGDTWDVTVRGALDHLGLSVAYLSTFAGFEYSPFCGEHLRKLLEDRAMGSPSRVDGSSATRSSSSAAPSEEEDEEWEADRAAVEDLMTFPSGPWDADGEEEEDMWKFLDELDGGGIKEEERDMIEFPPAPSDYEVFQGGSLWAASTTRGLERESARRRFV